MLLVVLFVSVRQRQRRWTEHWHLSLAHESGIDDAHAARRQELIYLEQQDVRDIVRPVRIYPPAFLLLFLACLMIKIASPASDTADPWRFTLEQVANLLISAKSLAFVGLVYLQDNLYTALGATTERHQNRFKQRVRLMSDLTVHLLPAENCAAPAADNDDPVSSVGYVPPDSQELRPIARFADSEVEPARPSAEKRRPTMAIRRDARLVPADFEDEDDGDTEFASASETDDA
jgi:hypothetical protein